MHACLAGGWYKFWLHFRMRVMNKPKKKKKVAHGRPTGANLAVQATAVTAILEKEREEEDR